MLSGELLGRGCQFDMSIRHCLNDFDEFDQRLNGDLRLDESGRRAPGEACVRCAGAPDTWLLWIPHWHTAARCQ